MKTFIELEQIGITGMYKEDYTLYIITKDSTVWEYQSAEKMFRIYTILM